MDELLLRLIYLGLQLTAGALPVGAQGFWMVWAFYWRWEDVVLHYVYTGRQWMHRCNPGETGNAGWSYWCTVLLVDWQLLGESLFSKRVLVRLHLCTAIAGCFTSVVECIFVSRFLDACDFC